MKVKISASAKFEKRFFVVCIGRGSSYYGYRDSITDNAENSNEGV